MDLWRWTCGGGRVRLRGMIDRPTSKERRGRSAGGSAHRTVGGGGHRAVQAQAAEAAGAAGALQDVQHHPGLAEHQRAVLLRQRRRDPLERAIRLRNEGRPTQKLAGNRAAKDKWGPYW